MALLGMYTIGYVPKYSVTSWFRLCTISAIVSKVPHVALSMHGDDGRVSAYLLAAFFKPSTRNSAYQNKTYYMQGREFTPHVSFRNLLPKREE